MFINSLESNFSYAINYSLLLSFEESIDDDISHEEFLIIVGKLKMPKKSSDPMRKDEHDQTIKKKK